MLSRNNKLTSMSCSIEAKYRLDTDSTGTNNKNCEQHFLYTAPRKPWRSRAPYLV